MVSFYASSNEALRTHQNRALDGVQGSLLQRPPILYDCDIDPMLLNMTALVHSGKGGGNLIRHSLIAYIAVPRWVYLGLLIEIESVHHYGTKRNCQLF